MIGALLLVVGAQAADPARIGALHALRDEFHATTNRATDAERDADYDRACRLGWRPACAPWKWRDGVGEPVAERLAEVLDPVCAAGDRLACYAVDRFGRPHLSPEQLVAQCDDGFAPACTAAAGALPDRREALLARGCLGAGEATGATIPSDPLACRASAEFDPVRLADACAGKDGAACATLAEGAAAEERRGWLEKACAGGDAMGCVALAVALEETLPPDPTLDEAPDPEEALLRSERHTALQRSCDLGHAPGCTLAARDYAQGRGVTVERASAHDGYWSACQLGDGEGCAYLAEAILDRETEAFGVAPRELYRRGCELDHSPSCWRYRRFDKQQRFDTRRLLRGASARFLPYAQVRPWLGGSIGVAASIRMPRVDDYAARRRIDVLVEQGALDYTLGELDRRETPENLSTFAAQWRQEPVVDRAWGARVAVGTQWWEGAPAFDDDALVAAAPGEASQTFDLATFVARADLERTVRDNPRVGVGVSLSSITAWETQELGEPQGSVGRAVLSVFRRAPSAHPQPMRGGATELSGYVGAWTGDAQGHLGVWFTDVRSIPLIHTSAGRDTLSLVSDVAVGLRRGAVPHWLAHHHPPQLAPSLGSWQLLRGQPAALMRGVLPVRGRAGLRWWIAEYHGLPQHVGFYVTPFVEAGAVWPELGTAPRWRSDGGLSTTVTWRRRTALHLEALAVPDLEDGSLRVVPSIVIQQVLDPWR